MHKFIATHAFTTSLSKYKFNPGYARNESALNFLFIDSKVDFLFSGLSTITHTYNVYARANVCIHKKVIHR